MADESYIDRLVDKAKLSNYLTERIGEVNTFGLERHTEGHSNETLFVEWGERDLVIRRPPPGETASTAHDMIREFEVVDALQDTAVPVPPTVALCDDQDVIGSEFYVMDRLEGVVARDQEPALASSATARKRIGDELVDTLARIHNVDYEAVGLGELGKPSGFTQRQVDRWGKQLRWAFERTESEREVPQLYRVDRWLRENCPNDHPHTLVHGDYKLDNVMFGRSPPIEIIAVFDWEMATLGDPRVDLGWMLWYWRDENDPEPFMEEYVPRFMEHPDYPTRDELIDRWERLTELNFEHERFYRVLAVYKIAAIDEMFFRRYLEGNSNDPLYAKMEKRVPYLAQRAVDLLDKTESL